MVLMLLLVAVNLVEYLLLSYQGTTAGQGEGKEGESFDSGLAAALDSGPLRMRFA